jgi:transcriptional regulator with XRE-family HTH domain
MFFLFTGNQQNAVKMPYQIFKLVFFRSVLLDNNLEKMKQPELGKQVAAFRISKGLTQSDLAEKCRVNIRTIQRTEAGKVMPRAYTLNLLNVALQSDFTILVDDDRQKALPKQTITFALFGGFIYIINGVPVVYDLITKSLNPTIHLFTTILHIISCIFFFGGFYAIGKYYKNRILAVSTILMVVMLPSLNILHVFNFNGLGQLLLFILMSVNMIIIGVGFLIESFGRSGHENSIAYKISGILTILISGTYLSMTPNIIYTGLVISLPANLLMLYILYRERHHAEKYPEPIDQTLALR